MGMVKWIILGVVAYFLGTIPFGYLVGKANGTDVRQHGSGNVGFTNVWRVLGIKYAAIVLAGDFGKGFLAAFIGNWIAGTYGVLVASLIAILGHTFNCFLNFKGGKGIATGAGCLCYMSPLTFLILAVVLVAVVGTTKYMSLGSILAAWLAPIVLYFMGAPMEYVVGIGFAAAYVIILHIPNIQRLMKGTENKIGHRKENAS